MSVEPSAFGAAIDRESRRATVVGSTTVPGGDSLTAVDFVEVLSNHRGLPDWIPGAPSQRTLLVHLVSDVADASFWAGVRPRVDGGVRDDPRVNPVGVQWAFPASVVTAWTPGDPGPLTQGDHDLVERALPASAAVRRSVLVVRTTTSGDWSTYTLHLLRPTDDGTPAGFDPPMASAEFSFTVDCPNDVDCCGPAALPPPDGPSPVLDYLARDFDALRTRLLDRVATLVPGWDDRNPADPAVMLVELFAAVGDRLGYWQDAVALEAYLGTARRRTSVRRHARLLDYAVHEGCAARVWLAFTTDAPTDVPAGAPVTDVVPEAGWRAVEAYDAGGVVVETAAPAHLVPARNAVPLYAWGDTDHVLPAGSTSAYLLAPATQDPHLHAGDVLVLVDDPVIPPTDPHPPATLLDRLRLGDPGRRFAVRLDADPVVHHDPYLGPDHLVLEIHWDAQDALARPLRVSGEGPGGAPVPRAAAMANVVLADQGATVPREPVVALPAWAPGRDYRPRLARTGVVWAEPVGPARPDAGAVALASPDASRAAAQVWVDDGERTYDARADLLASGPLDAHVVVEPDDDGVARLRFGDGVAGRDPADAPLWATYRLGGGGSGNVGAGRLDGLLARTDGSAAATGGAHLDVWNPLAATGGRAAEPVEQVRRLAPTAYRRQLRAVTDDDYAVVAGGVPGVQRAVARRRWTGSWYAEEVMVDPELARARDAALPVQVSDVLEVRRMAGLDVEVRRPVYVPLLVRIEGCVQDGYVGADVQRGLADVFSAHRRPDGSPGFFDPDRFTFGQPLYLSDVVATAMSVTGVAWVEVTVFGRLSDGPAATAANLAQGRVRVGRREVLRCDTDASNPENGRVDLRLRGGS
ncbi:hypothetical protein [Cellulomonas sp. ICMP 17802]|uniref:hypothetical protein n=1 Tax=Cellulomonas sp. ICMP 17802 TaxID=3239199 RepID=UPI00351B1198